MRGGLEILKSEWRVESGGELATSGWQHDQPATNPSQINLSLFVESAPAKHIYVSGNDFHPLAHYQGCPAQHWHTKKITLSTI